MKRLTWVAAATIALALSPLAHANEAAIRKGIAERLPDFPKIDEVRSTPIPGLFELRVGMDLFYSDATGQYLLQDAHLIDLKTKRNLTQARIDQLSSVDFASLPLKDALVWKRGNGERKLAVFADPNCGYCKRLERTLQDLKDVTVYTFLMPILGEDSTKKSKAIWCAKDNATVWLDWMLRAKPPTEGASCDDEALERNKAFARKHRITGTPALLFEDGTRVPGAIGLAAIEERLKRGGSKG
ncbi:DsbC family protein [Pseudorhodoferax sp.]|jgi:thiol:disulfide interchange protein DsbC|uniref:DsbC family protein n=1 Tax=Pseudorhodoferax sp. TaxID=1993553 RepID=UPI002DD6B638|nr:DsbC family protein [Pseudorhodoferax sp.]